MSHVQLHTGILNELLNVGLYLFLKHKTAEQRHTLLNRKVVEHSIEDHLCE